MAIGSDPVLDGPTLLRIERLKIGCGRRREHESSRCSIPRSMIPFGTAMGGICLGEGKSAVTLRPALRVSVQRAVQFERTGLAKGIE
jgi:hypothetical protein